MKKVYVKRDTSKGYVEEEFKIESDLNKLQEKELKLKGWALASIADLINDICLGGDPIRGLLEVEDGIYVWDRCDGESDYEYIQL